MAIQGFFVYQRGRNYVGRMNAAPELFSGAEELV